MPEPTTVGLTALGVFVGKDAISKILGPTYNYLGEELLAFTKKRIENTGKIFSNAEKKLGDKLDRPGQVPPKVLKTIINEGSYSDDAIAAEYFGGALASARTEVHRDDRGARMTKLIDNLSTYQIRFHYLMYSTIAELFSYNGFSLSVSDDRWWFWLHIPFQDFCEAMDFTQQELNNDQLLSHIFHGLTADNLIDSAANVSHGRVRYEIGSGIPYPSIIGKPSALGAELFLWAFGQGDKQLDFLLTDDLPFEIEGIPKSFPNAASLQELLSDEDDLELLKNSDDLFEQEGGVIFKT